MKGILLGIAVLLLLVFTATDSQAQCQKCGPDPYGCTTCLTTNYDGAVLCTLVEFGNETMCFPAGGCNGYLGADGCAGSAKSGCVVLYVEDRRGPHLPYRSGEWKLVSVTVKRGPDGRSSL
jgi:hypothetical protein